MSAKIDISVRRRRPLEVEVDRSCHSAYIRFRTGQVHRTIAQEDAVVMVAVDLDSDENLIGIELVGVPELSAANIRHYLPQRFRSIGLEGVRFVVVGSAA